MIQCVGVSKFYKQSGVKAVNSIDLTVEPGKIWGFLGPNGAGKSSLIKMIVGLLQPTEGTISVKGIDVVENPLQVKKMIGYVPDGGVVYPGMTGLQFFNFVADMYEVDSTTRKSRIEKYAEIFEFTDALDRKVSGYSHGMSQKLAIIGALLHDPEVLILDEPQGGLDPKANFILKEIMRELCQQGKTVFFSTHVLDIAEKLCDHVSIIKKGSIIANGTLSELRHSPGQEHASLEQLFLELTDDE